MKTQRIEQLKQELEQANSNTIRIGQLPSELTGQGTEYLVRNGSVIAKFFNGNFVGAIPKGNSDLTVSAA